MALRAVLPTSAEDLRVRLVVVEDGACGFDTFVTPDQCEETVVVVQCDGELPIELSRRTIRRIAVLERSSRAVGKAIMVVAPRLDDQSMAARHLLARALLVHAHLTLGDTSELVLAIDGGAEDSLRHELMALVDVLVGESGSSSVPIRIRFGTPGESSGPAIRKSGYLSRSRPECAGAPFDRALVEEQAQLKTGRHAALSN